MYLDNCLLNSPTLPKIFIQFSSKWKEKVAKDVEEVTSSSLPKKFRDAYYKELNDFNNWKQENDFFNAKKRVVLILILNLCITFFDVQ
jgi:hypothetical protein